MKSNVYCRGLPPQWVQATIADAGITANSAEHEPRDPLAAGRQEAAHVDERARERDPDRQRLPELVRERDRDAGDVVEAGRTGRSPGGRTGALPGARSKRFPISTWCADSRIQAKYWSWSAGKSPSEPDSGRPRVSSGSRMASEVPASTISASSSSGSSPRRAPAAATRPPRERPLRNGQIHAGQSSTLGGCRRRLPTPAARPPLPRSDSLSTSPSFERAPCAAWRSTAPS